MFITPTATTQETEALWNDFDLDAAVDVDMDDMDVAQFWNAANAITTIESTTNAITKIESTTNIQASKSTPVARPTIIAVQSATHPSAQSEMQRQASSQDLDPEECRLSDYERKTRLGRRACKPTHHLRRSDTLSTTTSCVDDTGLEPKCLELKYCPMLSGLRKAEMQAEMQKSTIEIACNKGTPNLTKISDDAIQVNKRKLWQQHRPSTPRMQANIACILADDQDTSKTVQSKTVQANSVLDTARSRGVSSSTASNKIKNKKRLEAIAAL
ncbi:hypothetical protein NDA18_005496 [Ustilago nuda]|nr:hypothetical protein NDA18_005496 [Ustilago nuda]